MGNKLGKRRYAVDERYTRPQGLYQHMDVDRKKLRKLILDSKLAPCYPGGEESTLDLEECPICFLHYPSLNRSRCCMKGICTECFLQMKPPPSACSASCPFCKTSNYAVEYRGMRTKEERGLEEMEEQKFIEAQIRMQQREHRDEEERLRKRRSLRSSNRTECEIPSSSTPEPSYAYAVQHGEEFLSCEIPRSSPVNWAPRSRANRYEDLDMDLQISFTAEDLWRDIQSHSNLPMIPACGGSGGDGGGIPLETLMPEFFYSHQEIPNPRPPPRPTTARQQAAAGAHVAAPPHPPPYCLPEAERVAAEEYSHPEWMTQWAAMGVTAPPRAAETWGFSDGVCYSAGLVTAADGAGYRFPENVEEQMMLAMAVSPMEARGGAAWM